MTTIAHFTRTAMFLGTVLLSACASSGGQPAGMDADLSETRIRYTNAMQQRNSSVLEPFFAPSAKLSYRVAEYVGRARILGFFRSSGNEYVYSTLRLGRVTTNGEAEITERGRWYGRTRNGSYTHVWARLADGQWLLKSIDISDDP